MVRRFYTEEDDQSVRFIRANFMRGSADSLQLSGNRMLDSLPTRRMRDRHLLSTCYRQAYRR